MPQKANRPRRSSDLGVRVKGCGKSAPRTRQQGRHGKPHREQDRIGTTRRLRAQALLPGCRPGWLLEAASNGRPRGMVATSGLRLRALQNPAYRPADTLFIISDRLDSVEKARNRCFAYGSLTLRDSDDRRLVQKHRRTPSSVDAHTYPMISQIIRATVFSEGCRSALRRRSVPSRRGVHIGRGARRTCCVAAGLTIRSARAAAHESLRFQFHQQVGFEGPGLNSRNFPCRIGKGRVRGTLRSSGARCAGPGRGWQRTSERDRRVLVDTLPYSDERDQLSTALFGTSEILKVDPEGRVILTESVKVHAGIDDAVTFVGLGHKFQIWEPERFRAHLEEARTKVRELKKVLGARMLEPRKVQEISPGVRER